MPDLKLQFSTTSGLISSMFRTVTNRNRVTPELLRELLGTIAVSEVCDVSGA